MVWFTWGLSWLTCMRCFLAFLSLPHDELRVGCGTWLYRFLIFAFFLTLNSFKMFALISQFHSEGICVNWSIFPRDRRQSWALRYCKFGHFREGFIFGKFRILKSSQKGEITISTTEIIESCPSHEIFRSKVCLGTSFSKLKFSRKFPDLQYQVVARQ